MATAATLSSGQPAANRKIFNIMQGAMKIPLELREALDSAAEAFNAKSYKTAVKYYKVALELVTGKDEKRQSQMLILIKYMLCMCLLESTEAKDLLDSLSTLEELQTTYDKEYPMLYYAVGKAYFKLYRFNKACGILESGFSVLNSGINVVEYNIPGTNTIIPESSKNRLVAALVSLNHQCCSWHRPDAVCCMPDCSKYSQNEGADKNIFFGSPTFNGMVKVTCNNSSNFCIMIFHFACWKAKKEQLCSLGKMSDRDVLNWECFTPNCENQGVKCTIKKIEIYDENAKIKALIEPRAEDAVWHAKPNPPSKGAIRKQQPQQTPKVRVASSDVRTAPYERPSRPQSTPNNVSTNRPKVEENEEDDDVHDEQALKTAIEKLEELRANNFGIKDEEIWRPDLGMYGNEYMLATAELMPDPDFTDEGVEEADLKAFFFSYFYTFVSETGPVKLDVLAEKWNESKDIHANCDLVLKHYLDITEFLLQSVKFALVGNYICVAEKLPKAYELAKTDTCEILRFFMENDVDQRSNSSSGNDEALFDAFVNQEKNNNSLPYSLVSEDDKVITKETSVVSDAPGEILRNDYEKSISEPKEEPLEAASSLLSTPEIQIKSVPEFESNAQENSKISAPEVSKAVEKKIIVPTEIPVVKDAKIEKLIRKSGQKRAHSVESPRDASVEKDESEVKKEYKIQDKSSSKATDGVKNNREIKEIVNSPAKPSFEVDKLMKTIEKFSFGTEKPSKPIINFDFGTKKLPNTIEKLSFGAKKLANESKSTDNLRTSAASPTDDCNVLMSNSGEPANRPIETKKRHFLSSPTTNGMNNFQRTPQSPNNQQGKQDSAFVAELIEKMHNMTGELANDKEKINHLESEIERLKKAYTAMKIRMLQKSLHGQYALNHNAIMSKLEECRDKSEVCAGIQSMLMSSIGQNAPSYGPDWSKIIPELERIAKNHETKFNELNDQLYNTKDPEKLKEVNLQLENLPEMPQMKLMDVIQAAFGFYRMHQMKEFQRLQITIPPPQMPIRPPQPQAQPQPQQLFGGPQHRPSGPDYYTGAQIVQPNAGLVHHSSQPNFLRSLGSQNVGIPSQRNSGNPVTNYQLIRNVPPPSQNYPYYGNQYAGFPYQPPSVPSIPQIPSTPVQQHAFNSPIKTANETQQQIVTPLQNVSPINQITSPAPQNAPSSHFFSPEKQKITTQSFLPNKRSFPVATQQNGQSSEQNSSLPPRRPNSVAEIENQHNSEQNSGKIGQAVTPGFVGPDLPLLSPARENTSSPVPRKFSFLSQEQNFELTKDSQRANSAPEIPKFFMAQDGGASQTVKKLPARENKENVEEPKETVERKAKELAFAEMKNNGATNLMQNWNSNILQAPLLFRDGASNVEQPENNDSRGTKNDWMHFDAYPETKVSIGAEKHNDESKIGVSSSAKVAKIRKKTEHSLDKLMRKLREQHSGVLELDLLKGIECVRKKHNNSLSGLPISRIMREAERFILDRQQKQLCGYGKRPQSQYFAVANASPWLPPDAERKRQSSISSTSSGSSLKKEAQHSLSMKKQWEPVTIPNDTWNRETPESDCAICFDSMLNTDSYTLQCKHSFHKLCIKNWYQHNQSCPTCRVHSTIDDEYPPLPLG